MMQPENNLLARSKQTPLFLQSLTPQISQFMQERDLKDCTKVEQFQARSDIIFAICMLNDVYKTDNERDCFDCYENPISRSLDF